MTRFLHALAFLTRIPVPGPPMASAADVGRAAALFPAAGALLGAIVGLTGRVLADRMPPFALAALLFALLTVLTGALHLDGLADTADGFGGGRTREDVLRIMRDHAVGAYGAAAMVVTAILEVALLAALCEGHMWRWMVVAPALARWTPVPLARALPYARAGGGLGASLTEHAGRTELAVASLLALALAVGLCGLVGLAAAFAVGLFTLLHGAACRRKLGGVTGDTLGAAVELAQVVALLVGVVAG